MRVITRIASAIVVAIVSVFVATPALASGGGIDEDSMFNHAGDGVDYVAIGIVGVVLLAIVLIGSTLFGSMFDRR